MANDSSPPEGANTSIIIRMTTRDTLSDCKHGKDTYDSVINRLIAYYRKATGNTIVD